MRIPALLAAAALLGQAVPPPSSRDGLRYSTFSAPAQGLKLWLPEAYEADPLIARKYVRKPTIPSPDVVTARLEYSISKRPEPPPTPEESDLLKIEPTLTNLKVTPGLSTWRGRPVSEARYEGFVQGKVGVYGRMIWLPLEPGTVVLHLYAEPPSAATMNQDWDRILSAIEGAETALTLRERDPGRWRTSVALDSLGSVILLVGLVMILARMNETIGGVIVLPGLVLPVLPLGYALFHLPECWRGLVLSLVGAAILGAGLVLAH